MLKIQTILVAKNINSYINQNFSLMQGIFLLAL